MKLTLTQKIKDPVLRAVFQSLETQVNLLAEGRLTGRHFNASSIPTSGSFAKGDIVWESQPTVMASVVSGVSADYMRLGWLCTESGEPGPGTLKEIRVLTGSGAVVQALPRGHLQGGKLSNNATDATNDIDVAEGEARDSTNAANITWSALTKQLDAAWAAGTNAGGLDTGSVADGTYHVFAIKKDSDGSGDVLFSTSATSPTMPTGYTYFRRIGSILRESAAIVVFTQLGDEFLRAPVTDFSVVSQGTAATLRTLSVPTGIKVWAKVGMFGRNATVGTSISIYSPDMGADNGLAFGLRTEVSGNGQSGDFKVRTNTSGQVYTDSTVASSEISIQTYGWIDRRGRDD